MLHLLKVTSLNFNFGFLVITILRISAFFETLDYFSGVNVGLFAVLCGRWRQCFR